MKRFFISMACLFAFLGVGLGAFGAHALNDVLIGELRTVYQTAVDYQMIHALALLLVGILCGQQAPDRWLKAAGVLFISGIILFSSSLYLIAVFQYRGFVMMTPVGGLAFLLGWLCLAVSAMRSR